MGLGDLAFRRPLGPALAFLGAAEAANLLLLGPGAAFLGGGGGGGGVATE